MANPMPPPRPKKKSFFSMDIYVVVIFLMWWIGFIFLVYPTIFGSNVSSIPSSPIDPSKNACPRMQYWNPKPSDHSFIVPYAKYGNIEQLKYLTFEPDYGGFNNIRMTLESMVVFAIATNRTIVLPPKAPIYLLKNNENNISNTNKNSVEMNQKKPKLRSIIDFFSEGIDELRRNRIVDIITFEIRDTLLLWNNKAEQGNEEYRKKIRQWIRVSNCGSRLGDATQIQIEQLIKEQKSFNKEEEEGGGPMHAKTQPKGYQKPSFKIEAESSSFIQFPKSISSNIGLLQSRCPKFEPLKEALFFGECLNINQTWPQNPLIADKNHRYSAEQFLTSRRRKHLIDANQAAEPWIHFQTDIKTGYRSLFTHWYTFFLFEHYPTDLYMKRIVRDYIHYDQKVFCAAEKIIAKLNDEGASMNIKANISNRALTDHLGGNEDTVHSWSSIHIRHGELQYTNVQISPDQLLEETSPWLNRQGELLYIATDEKELRWFLPLEKRHKIRFLQDYMTELEDLDSSLYGMVEQVVLSKGRTFTGTWFSTFSAYVCRLRGYQRRFKSSNSLNNEKEFDENSCYVYAPKQKKFDFQTWKMPSHAFYPREWSLAWEGIDYLRDEQEHIVDVVDSALPPYRLLYSDFKNERMIYPDAAVKKKKQEQQGSISSAVS